MADNTRRNLKEEEEYLKLQQQIRDAAKESGKSLRDMGQYSKTIAANYIEMQKVSAKINELQKELNNASEERASIIRQEIEGLKKEQEQLRSINKEMASIGNLARLSFQGIVTYLGQAITGYLEFSQKTKDVAATIGLSSSNMYMMQKNIEQASTQMLRYGVSHTDALEAQQAYSDELGRAVILSESALINMSEIGKATGLGMQGMAGLTSQMELFGLGAEQSTQFIYSMYEESAKMGLNAGKVIKKFQENLGLLNKLNFKAGVAGLKEMAKFSEKYKLDMNSVAAVADKVFRPEGAIEAAAQLQVLGGSLAALGDPFQLMYKARNAPEELAKSLTKAAVASATFNEKTGEFEVNAYELDRLREGAQALGMDYQELVQTAKQGAKIRMFEGMLSGKGLTDEERDAVSMMAQMKDGKAMIQIGGDMKELSSLNEDQLKGLINYKKSAKDAAEQATGIMERIQNFTNQILTAVYPLFSALEQYLEPMVQTLTEKTTGWAESLKEFFSKFDFSEFFTNLKDFVINLWDKLKWAAQNWKLALGIAATAFVGYWVGSQIIAGKIFGASAGASFRATSGMGITGGGGGGGMTPAQQMMSGKGAQAAGMGSMMKSLGSAAQILALGAALMMVAKSVDIFADAMIKMKGVGMGEVAAGLSFVVVGLGALGVVAALVGPVTPIILALGAAMLMIGGAVFLASSGLSILADSFTKMFESIGPNGDSVLKAGLGFLSFAAGVGALSVSLLALSATSLLAIPGLLVLNSVTSMLTETATALSSAGGGEGISKTIQAINSVDTEKLEALKSLSNWMSLLGATTTIKFDENLKVAGSIEIKGEAGGKTNTDWIRDPIFVSKLKEVIKHSDNSGAGIKPNSRSK